MKIGIFVLSIGSFGKAGFYNLQEIGLAKALDSLCDEVKVYKLVPNITESKIQTVDGTRHTSIEYLPSKSLGTNGIPDMKLLDKTLDVLICFSDTQIMLPKVFKWAQRNNIKFIPYIGVVESHSTSKIKQAVTNFLFKKNIAVYRQCVCCVKTPTVQQGLMNMGVKNTVVTPVGLDTDLLRKDFDRYSKIDLKKKYGYQKEDKVLLFIGRFIEEKQPVRMIDILSEIRKKDQSYKLLMVGKGELKQAVEDKIREYDLADSVQIIEEIPNSEIWELYRFADTFVNLNQQEIFGMAILEAMYYGCKVVACEAPGPNLIIENGKSGFLVNSNQGLMNCIVDGKLEEDDVHIRIVNSFTWEQVARIMSQQIRIEER